MAERVWMRDATWDAYLDLSDELRREAIGFFSALTAQGPEALGLQSDQDGRYFGILGGTVLVPFIRRPDPDGHLWVYPPIGLPKLEE